MSDYTYTDKRKFYNSGVWSYARNRVLRRDAFLCQMSKRYGKFRPAKVVHHIFPLEYYPEYRLKEWNLISLSVEWHEKLHDRTGHRLSYEGWRLLEKTAAKRSLLIQATIPTLSRDVSFRMRMTRIWQSVSDLLTKSATGKRHRR